MDPSALERAADARAMASLVAAARELSAAGSEQEVLRVVTDRGVALLGAQAMGLALPEPGGERVRTLSTSFDAEFLASVEHLPADLALPLVRTAVTGAPVLLPDLASTAPDFPAAVDLYTRTGVEASAAVPLWAGERLLGSLSVAMDRPHRWRRAERELLEAFAGLTAQALDRLAARDAERAASAQVARFSEVLQRSLLTRPAALEHLQVAVRYSPAAADAKVGGDWYDAFTTRTGTIHLVIGDVTGHDSRAAAAMGQMRNLLRGIGHALDDAPAAVLSALDLAVHDLDVGALATVVLAQVEHDAGERTSGRRTVRWSSAGHLPPLLITAGAPSRYLETPPDLLMGLLPRASRHDHEVVLEPGSVLLLSTDGLVERRGTPLQDSLHWLATTADGLAALPLEELCDALLALVGDGAEDDVAVLALRAEPADLPLAAAVGDGADDGAAVELPAAPGTPRRARDFVLARCRAAGVSDAQCDVVQLLTSELATNAVVHARSPARISVRVSEERVRVEVGDDDSRHPRVGSMAVEALGGRGVVLVDVLATSWGVRDEPVGKTVWFTLDR